MTLALAAPCTICKSTRWCERQCKNAPKPNVDNDNHKPIVINVAPATSALTNTQRQARWRAANRGKHRERNRNLMRQKRATENTATT